MTTPSLSRSITISDSFLSWFWFKVGLSEVLTLSSLVTFDEDPPVLLGGKFSWGMKMLFLAAKEPKL